MDELEGRDHLSGDEIRIVPEPPLAVYFVADLPDLHVGRERGEGVREPLFVAFHAFVRAHLVGVHGAGHHVRNLAKSPKKGFVLVRANFF